MYNRREIFQDRYEVMVNTNCRVVLAVFCAFVLLCGIAQTAVGQDAATRSDEFFEKRIRPVLVEHCYECHSAEAKALKGELRLDSKAGWQVGGESGEPAVLPGKPDESPLIRAVRHDDDVSAMPPNQPRLSDPVLADLTAWIRRGAFDPRDGKLTRRNEAAEWESEYRSRLEWWSLGPLSEADPPAVKQASWARTDVDRFVLAKLEANRLEPTRPADRLTLARRLSFALTGLPPQPELVERFLADTSPQAYDELVTALLDSPHFGERWARHWMDVVHYSDTHGYEWDVPAKNAWRYRDYLIRAFNADIPYRQMVLEQIAGDLIEPRIDAETGLNESLIGPMALRLGERRHGDNAAVEGVTQEAVANMIDTLGKAFLATTLACAQCHNHKLDAVEQRDYYALAGVLMSTRFSARVIDAFDPNEAVIDELREIKRQLRAKLAGLWLDATDPDHSDGMVEKIKAIPANENAASSFPASGDAFWKRSPSSPITAEEFARERERRIANNQSNLTLLADLTREDGAEGWRWEGVGMKHGLVDDGEIVVADAGDDAVMHILPAGRFSHVWSQRLAGSLQSPQLDPVAPVTMSVEMVGGKFASQSFIVDRALHSERLKFITGQRLGWSAFTAGNFSSLEGTPDKAKRLVYLEFATKSLNNYFPPRVGYDGVSEAEIKDPRSWFGVTRVYQHAPGQGPQDELRRYAPLFDRHENKDDWARRLAALLHSAVQRWAAGKCDSDDVLLLNEALGFKLLPNDIKSAPDAARLVAEYRAIEKRLQPDRTVGSAADWDEGRDERLGIRGSYTDFGYEVARGGPRFLRGTHAATSSSGRLELAHSIAGDRNPLTARVYVNRVWHYLFGEGLVRTPDDFGHLGERPTHPELLDHLASRFVDEGWSTKKLIRLLVTSATWRQGSLPDANARDLDPENRLWHHLPMRRLEAEAIRDSILAVSGRLNRTLFGPPIEPYRPAEDPQKRLFKGPLDGHGRRSVYVEMTLMEPPRFLALFNQPIPKQTVGRRDVTNVPDQALALLNDPFVIALAEQWSKQLVADEATSTEQRIERMLTAALTRPPDPEETARLLQLIRRSAALRGATDVSLLDCQPAWQDAAHAIFNLKEFIHVP
jgi:mono/diheme cytochrome c family protein